MDWILGQTSKKYEVGNGGPDTISYGKGDNGGASYGSYQLSSNMGSVASFVKEMGYSKQFKGLVPGTVPFNNKWRELAKNPSFGEAQHQFIKKNYYDIQLSFLKEKGIDLSKRGYGVQDAIWSTSVQFGPTTSLILNSLKGIDVDNSTDAQIVTYIQDYKILNNDRLFRSSSLAVRNGTLNRAKRELQDLLVLC